jgi:hypothetical protein
MVIFVNAVLKANSGEWAEPSPQNLERGIWNLFFRDVITALPAGKPGTWLFRAYTSARDKPEC